MRFTLFLTVSLLFKGVNLRAQEEHGLVKWLTFKEAQEKNKIQANFFGEQIIITKLVDKVSGNERLISR